jgi:tetratricopeptide (TPR) repeat protein
MNYDLLISFTPDEFEKYLLKNTGNLNTITLYNSLVKKIDKEPEKVLEFIEIAIQVYESSGEDNDSILFLELKSRYYLAEGKLDVALKTIQVIMSKDSGEAEVTALELADEIMESPRSFGISLDQTNKVLYGIGTIFKHYDKQYELAELYLKSANIYSHYGASQSAYRCVGDAEEIAVNLQSLPLIAECYSTLVVIACEEPDFDWAIDVGMKAIEIYKELEQTVPASLYGNLGVAYMNIDDTPQALFHLNNALSCSDISRSMNRAIRVNLSTCLRRNNQLPEAEAILTAVEAETKDISEDDPEHALEHTLSSAKLAIAKRDIPLLTECLYRASNQLDELMLHALRLHHRRGLRERYISRIEGLLHSLPVEGAAADALLPIVTTHGNTMGDWLSILSWANELKKESNFDVKLAEKIDDILLQIRRVGAPHLYGFREKYDDSWSIFNSAEVWDELSEICLQVKSMGFGLPLEKATSQSQFNLCQKKLEQGHCLMATTYAGENLLIWFFIKKRYHQVAIQNSLLEKWHIANYEFANANISRNEFTNVLSETLQTLSSLLDPLFSEVASAGCKSIRYIEDSLRILPLTAFALRNRDLKKRMATGDFQVRLVPAMIEELYENSPITSVVSIFDPLEDLQLAPHEGLAFTRAVGLTPPVLVKADNKEELTSLIGGYDVITVSTHGSYLGMYTDAYFAKLGAPDASHLITVSSLQESAPDLKVRLAILNTCYSGSTSVRNFQKRFRTSDAVAIPNLFMLNRCAVALAGSWKISDTASFILAHLIGEKLKDGNEPSSALACAIASLSKVTRNEVITILKENLPLSVQETVIPRLNNAPEQGMFSHPYFTAGLAIHGLL